MLIGFVVGAVASAATSIISQAINNDGRINWWQVGIEALIGGVVGAISMSPAGVGWQIWAGAIAGLASYSVDCYIHEKDPTGAGLYWQ